MLDEARGAPGRGGAAYQLWRDGLACRLKRQVGGRLRELTSDELEGLGDQLVAVLVVRHDCGWFGRVESVGAAAMAGGQSRGRQ